MLPPLRTSSGSVPVARWIAAAGELERRQRRVEHGRSPETVARDRQLGARRAPPRGSGARRCRGSARRPGPGRARIEIMARALPEQDRPGVLGIAAREAVDVEARLGPVARVEVVARAAALRGVAPASASTCAPGGELAQDARSSAVGSMRPARSSSHSRPSASGISGASACMQRVARVQRGAAVHARVEVARRRAHVDRELHDRRARRSSARGCSSSSMPESKTIAQSAPRSSCVEPASAWWPPISSSPSTSTRTCTGSSPASASSAGHVQQRQEVALVVAGAARVQPAVAHLGLERVRVPLLDRRDVCTS